MKRSIVLAAFSLLLLSCDRTDHTNTKTANLYETPFLLGAIAVGAGQEFMNDGFNDDIEYFHTEEDSFFSLNIEFYERDKVRCRKANTRQKNIVKRGNRKRSKFLSRCKAKVKSNKWCKQIIRPNPRSINFFRCTYGSTLPHRLIHPSESTWKHAFKAITLIKELQAKGICVSQIYNWWRPEPYNKNVGGVASRHPYGTSIDVRFCSKRHQNKAHRYLCRQRRRGRIRALGYYPSTALHFGVGDHTGSTWGKACK